MHLPCVVSYVYNMIQINEEIFCYVLLGGSTVTTTVRISEIVNKEAIRLYVARVGGIIPSVTIDSTFTQFSWRLLETDQRCTD